MRVFFQEKDSEEYICQAMPQRASSIVLLSLLAKIITNYKTRMILVLISGISSIFNQTRGCSMSFLNRN